MYGAIIFQTSRFFNFIFNLLLY